MTAAERDLVVVFTLVGAAVGATAGWQWALGGGGFMLLTALLAVFLGRRYL